MKPQLLAAMQQSLLSGRSLSLRSDGPLVDVEVHFECEDGSCGSMRGKGLVDTGADRTAIDFGGVPEGARRDGFLMAQGVTSAAVAMPLYPVRLSFPGTGYPDVHIEHAPATPHLGAQGLVALIGRDVLEQSRLSYDGPSGQFELSTQNGEGFSVRSTSPLLLAAVGFGVLGLVGTLMLQLFQKPCAPCEAV